MPVIELSRARFDEFRTLEKEVGSLKDALETRKVIERAKGVLMEVHGLRESEAFHRIRKTSMDARKSMKEVAEAILLAHDMEASISAGAANNDVEKIVPDVAVPTDSVPNEASPA
jgi:response regulator NasT